MVKLERNPENVAAENFEVLATLSSEYKLQAYDNPSMRAIVNKDGDICATMGFTDSEPAFMDLVIYINSSIYSYDDTDPYKAPTETKLIYKKPEQIMDYAKILEANGYMVTIIY